MLQCVESVRKSTDLSCSLGFTVKNEDFFKTCNVDYHDGGKYPFLEPYPDKPDLLNRILE